MTKILNLINYERNFRFMKVAIYSRKSKSTDKGESIETQINLCKDYINKISDGKHIEIVQYDFQVEIQLEENLIS